MQRLRRTPLALSAAAVLTGGMALLGAIPAGALSGPQVTHGTTTRGAARAGWGVASGTRAGWGFGARAGWGLAAHARTVPGLAGAAAQGQPGGAIVLGGSPGAPLANPETSTVYVPVQCATSFCQSNTPGHVLDVINAATCNVKDTSGCRVVARAAAGVSPLAAALDERTGTIYVADGAGTVTVVNGARCNASVTSGCAKPLATIKTGGFPVAATFNPRTRTVYVASPAGQVFVINAARCNAVTTAGCGEPVKAVTDKAGPDAVAVDVATDTVYAANAGTGNGDTVSVINGATCNGRTGTGCGQQPPTVTVGVSPFWDTVDQATNTVYVANFTNGFNDGSVSVINGATCNAHTTTGCHRIPPAVPTGIGASFVALDGALHTVFAANNGDDTLSAFNTRTCDGTVTSGCAKRPPNLQATLLQGPGYNAFPSGLALIPRAGTAYVVTIGGRNLVSVTGIGRCNASNTTGCRAEAPTVPEGASLLSVDPATGTIYAGDLSKPQIDVINGATCHAGDLSGCAPVAAIPMPGPQAAVGAIDQATHTLYASDGAPSGAVAVIDTAACNATHTSGCAHHPPVIKIGAFPNAPAINPATRTLYVSYGTSASKVAVVNAATCNATNTTGCGQVPAVVKVGPVTVDLAVSEATDTIYAPSAGFGFGGDTVAVINGATCNGTDHSGCGRPAATAKAGTGPFGVAVNDATHTVYVVNNANGDAPGTVSVINGATCNATVTTGCGGPFPAAATGSSPLLIAADATTGTFYITDFSSASVTVLNGRRCNAAVTAGCRNATREQATGSGPFGIAVNPRTSTVYAADSYLPGSMSVFRTH